MFPASTSGVVPGAAGGVLPRRGRLPAPGPAPGGAGRFRMPCILCAALLSMSTKLEGASRGAIIPRLRPRSNSALDRIWFYPVSKSLDLAGDCGPERIDGTSPSRGSVGRAPGFTRGGRPRLLSGGLSPRAAGTAPRGGRSPRASAGARPHGWRHRGVRAGWRQRWVRRRRDGTGARRGRLRRG